MDQVGVAATGALACDVARVGELGDDAVCGSFGDPDALADVAQADAGLIGYAHQDLSVVGQECPAWYSPIAMKID